MENIITGLTDEQVAQKGHNSHEEHAVSRQVAKAREAARKTHHEAVCLGYNRE